MSIEMICVYCGSYPSPDPSYLNTAYTFGQELSLNGFKLVYGGGINGMMGKVADGIISQNGQSIGFIPELLLDKEGGHPGLSELHVVDSMHTRKMKMAETADAFVVMPGGFGTLDELFEVVTWCQIGIHHKPIVVMNVDGYWDHLEKLYHHIIDTSFARPDHRNIVKFTTSVDETIMHLKAYNEKKRASVV